MNTWRYDPDMGTDTTAEITFTCQYETTYQGRSYAPDETLTIALPHPIDRATLDDMAGEGGPWGWGGYTNQQLDQLAAGEF